MSLSENAKKLLVETAKGDGYVLFCHTLGGLTINPNGCQEIFNEQKEQNGRAVAEWANVPTELMSYDMIVCKNNNRNCHVYQLTPMGYHAVDKLNKNPNYIFENKTGTPVAPMTVNYNDNHIEQYANGNIVKKDVVSQTNYQPHKNILECIFSWAKTIWKLCSGGK